jgi:hypothetical protein
VDLENREDVIRGFFQSATMKGGSRIGMQSDRYITRARAHDWQFHEALQAPLQGVGQLFLKFEHVQARAGENSACWRFFVTTIFLGPNTASFLNVNDHAGLEFLGLTPYSDNFPPKNMFRFELSLDS